MPVPGYIEAVRREIHPCHPGSFPGLRAWVAAHRIEGLNDNDAITTAPDLSGRGNDYSQGTAGSKPLFKTNIVNGYPVMRFDGTDDFLESAYSASDESEQDQVWVAVFKTTSTTTQQIVFWMGEANLAGGFGPESEIHFGVGSAVDGNDIVSAYLGRSFSITGSNIAFTDTTNFHVLGVRFTGLLNSAPTAQIFLDGVAGNIMIGTQSEQVSWTGNSRIGRPFTVSRLFNGDLAELAVFNPAAWGSNVISNIQKLTGALRAKYALL